MIEEFDRPTIRDLRVSIDKALESVAEEFGIGIKTGSASYSPTEVTIKLSCGVKNDKGAVETRERQDFRTNAKLVGLSADDLDFEFSHITGERYRIVGMKPRSTKYPIVCLRVNDMKRFKFPVETIQFMMDQEKAKQAT